MALAKTRVRYVGGASTIPLLLGIGTIAVCSVNWPFRNSPTPIQSCFKKVCRFDIHHVIAANDSVASTAASLTKTDERTIHHG
jgi:hypothetical protein